MSALLGPDRHRDLDGLRRYHTKIRVLVHSHLRSDPIDVSDDVMQCSTSKTIKGVGKANLALVARRNYLNLLHPNDYINIYFNINDGSGWTRTFFGLIDRIEEEYTVGEMGEPATMYHVICSDFSKVLYKTNIIFNPHLALREDMRGEDFASANNIAGVALRSRGIFAEGSPADCVTNLLLLQLGFGSQWLLPESYPANVEDFFAQQRAEYAKNRLLSTINRLILPEDSQRLRAILDQQGLGAFQRDQNGQVIQALESNAGDDLFEASDEDRVNRALEAAGLQAGDLTAAELGSLRQAQDLSSLASALTTPAVRQSLFGSGLTEREISLANQGLREYAAQENAIARQGKSLADILNLTDFVERRSIDGYAFDLSIWTKQGPLNNIVTSVSNEVINEFFLDLRAMTARATEDDDPALALVGGTDFEYVADDAEGNLADNPGDNNGVRYMPAVVMREYPFSTVKEVNANNFNIEIGEGEDAVRTNLGVVYFGGVFSHLPNVAGRHMVPGEVINVEERINGLQGPDRTYRHLDVAVMSETEIRNSRLGRSDADHFNFFEMFSDNQLGNDHRYFMRDLLPIVTPIHIVRHGLRQRSVSTRFARYAPRVAQQVQPQASVPTPAETPPDPEEPTSFLPDVVPPVAAHPSLHFRNRGAMKYGYRRRSDSWRFHNGIDIYGRGPIGVSFAEQGRGNSPGPVDVVAIADGLIVGSVAQGTVRGMNLYGNTIIIYHPQFEGPNGEKVFSLYAHLAHREPFTGNTDNSTSLRDSCNRRYLGRGGTRFEPIPVRKGQKIGSVGVTAGSRQRGPNAVFQTDRAHLHFEIDYRVPSQNLEEAPAIPFTVLPATSPRPEATNSRGQDPVQFFADRGIDLVAAIRALGDNPVADDLIEENPDAVDHDDPAPPPARVEEDPVDEVEETAATASSQGIQGAADGVTVRKQIARWALLQDHWYQHNLEYVSGQMTTRPAPEVRVGYRLDILERNMSFYVESVQHSWNFPNEMQTQLQLTRGQPNNPYPSYVLPPLEGFESPRNTRRLGSRLASYFVIPDPIAVRRAISIRRRRANSGRDGDTFVDRNIIDDPAYFDALDYAESSAERISAERPYGGIIPATSIEDDTLADVLAASVEDEEGLEGALEELFSVFEQQDAAALEESNPNSPATSSGVDGSFGDGGP